MMSFSDENIEYPIDIFVSFAEIINPLWLKKVNADENGSGKR